VGLPTNVNLELIQIKGFLKLTINAKLYAIEAHPFKYNQFLIT